MSSKDNSGSGKKPDNIIKFNPPKADDPERTITQTGLNEYHISSRFANALEERKMVTFKLPYGQEEIAILKSAAQGLKDNGIGAGPLDAFMNQADSGTVRMSAEQWSDLDLMMLGASCQKSCGSMVFVHQEICEALSEEIHELLKED
jgi:hypothetical protein